MNLIDIGLIIQIFILINPPNAFPMLISAYKNKMNVKKIAIGAVFVAFLIGLIIIFIGPYLFKLFGISVDSFRLAGGIILLLVGIDTIRKDHDKKDIGKIDSVISVMATPILTGPATISFLIIKQVEVGYLSITTSLILAFILVALVIYVFASLIHKANERVISISSKVFGLFLTAIAIEMIAKGITGLLLVPK